MVVRAHLRPSEVGGWVGGVGGRFRGRGGGEGDDAVHVLKVDASASLGMPQVPVALDPSPTWSETRVGYRGGR